MGNFTASSLAIPDVLLIKPRKFRDARGFFMETYVESAFAAFGITARFVQDNHSLSEPRGTIRGLHFQRPPHAQAKLVRAVRGSAFDVAVDLRRGSPTFGKWCGAMLTADGGEQIFLPRGFAHGFCTCEPNTEIVYKVDDVYAPDCDAGLVWNDPVLAVEWPVAAAEVLVSDKDARLPGFSSFQSPF
jgi:dTDP-4-dehydrorhamnose 3,5-epimerase